MQNKWERLFDGFLELIDFGLVKYDDGFGLIDYQEADLGSISEDRFTNAVSLIDRLDIYTKDYIIEAIESCLSYEEIDYQFDYWEDLLVYRDLLPDNAWDFDVLEMICLHADEINLENCYYGKEDEIIDTNTKKPDTMEIIKTKTTKNYDKDGIKESAYMLVRYRTNKYAVVGFHDYNAWFNDQTMNYETFEDEYEAKQYFEKI